MGASVDITINAEDNASSVFGGLTVTLGDVLNIAGKVTGGLFDMFKSVVQESADAQEGQAALASVLESTGGKAGVTADQANELASALQLTTKFTDDQILSTENMLLTFTNISKDVFPDVTKTALNMSQALGQDTKASAIQLGKALNDPIKGISALSKVGVSFTEVQKEQIKALVAAGDTMGAQKIILSELNTEFGGAAEAAGKTFGGQMEILSHQFDDVKQQIGDALLPTISQLMGYIGSVGMPIIQQFGAWMGTNLPVAIDYLSQTVIPALLAVWANIQPTVMGVIAVIGTVIASFQSGGDGATAFGATITALQGYWAQLQPVVVNVVNAISAVVQAVFGVVQSFLDTHSTDISATMTDAWTRIQEIIKTGIELYNAIVPPVLTAIAGFIKAHGTQIQTVLDATWTAIKAVIDIALTLIQGVITVALDLIHGNWSKAWEDIKTMSAQIVTDIVTIIKAQLDALYAIFGSTIESIKTAWADFVKGASDMGNAIIQGIIQGVNNGVGALKDAVKHAAQDALDSAKHALGISSPSKVFADEVGTQISAGIAVGIRDAGGQITGALGDVTAPRATVRGMPSGGASASSGGGSARKGGDTHIYNVDARGSSLTRGQFEDSIRKVNNETGAKALSRVRSGN